MQENTDIWAEENHFLFLLHCTMLKGKVRGKKKGMCNIPLLKGTTIFFLKFYFL